MRWQSGLQYFTARHRPHFLKSPLALSARMHPGLAHSRRRPFAPLASLRRYPNCLFPSSTAHSNSLTPYTDSNPDPDGSVRCEESESPRRCSTPSARSNSAARAFITSWLAPSALARLWTALSSAFMTAASCRRRCSRRCRAVRAPSPPFSIMCAVNLRTTSTCPFSMAKVSGVRERSGALPLPVLGSQLAPVSAPKSRRVSTTSTCPEMAAACKGVLRSGGPLFAFTSAPSLTSVRTTSACPREQAPCIAGCPSLSCAPISAPSSTKTCEASA
mmetsp:Transcript_8005/g.16386  ORF Transcript_8005/g.16386 Transcript_8005/m.16386 type:complete len:274 (+) Transcript_8005:94-915(+)